MHSVKAGRASAQHYGVLKRGFAAYMRYLDILADHDGGVNASVGRVPTLAEWYGDVQRPSRMVSVGVSGGTPACDAVGAARVFNQGIGSGSDASDAGGSAGMAEVGGEAVSGCVGESECDGGACESKVRAVPSLVGGRGPNWERNRQNREKKKQNKRNRIRSVVDSGVDCGSAGSSVGSVHTVDTRTGVEIEASQTLAARRVAENRMAEAKAKVEAKLAEHRLVALQDKDRTKAVQKLAAARMEEKINKAKKNSEAYFKDCDQSLKSLGSTGSAGEFALKTQIKDARDNEAILAYVQEQNRILVNNASPEVLDAVSRVKKPVIEEEFDAFGDCPSDYNEDETEAYCNDRNRRNDEMAQRLQCAGEQPVYGRW